MSLPRDQRERFEQIVAHIGPELYEDVYWSFIDGNVETRNLKENKEKRTMDIL